MSDDSGGTDDKPVHKLSILHTLIYRVYKLHSLHTFRLIYIGLVYIVDIEEVDRAGDQ